MDRASSSSRASRRARARRSAAKEVPGEQFVGKDLACEQLVVGFFVRKEALLFLVESACGQSEVVGAGGEELAGDEAEELDVPLDKAVLSRALFNLKRHSAPVVVVVVRRGKIVAWQLLSDSNCD
ncbi:hypothetical protein FOMPIDRAFT_1062559 [Fomitopsis schrenkii]|uniref:Uncharacterized protein n=1 Tax=Fomitopsis schrenkii TaxID=2126942 RepID=S8FB67_FOMSC|nr:hypothetical protein FOMPIDRAFT_1062559 [Fomitopsis schrenkii]